MPTENITVVAEVETNMPDPDEDPPPFLALRPEPDLSRKGEHWRQRVEWNPGAVGSGLTEIADENATSWGPGAQRVEGSGNVISLTWEQVVWLHEQLGKLIAHRGSQS